MQRQRQPMTGRQALMLVAAVSMVGTAAAWWGIYGVLTDNLTTRIAYSAILTLAPPALMAFVIPWSPAGMLLQKINARTWGQWVVAACAFYLLYYAADVFYSWWAVQPVTVDTGLVWHQVGVGILGSIIIPALLFAPMPSQAIAAQIEQAHLVRRYEIQTEADLEMLRTTSTRVVNLARRGIANLNDDERAEFAAVARGLIHGMDQTLDEIYASVHYTANGADVRPRSRLRDNPQITKALDVVEGNLVENLPVPRTTHGTGYADEDQAIMDAAFARQAARRQRGKR